MLDNHDFTRRRKVAQAGFDAEWKTLLVATDPPLRSRTSGSETCRPAPSNVHGHVHNNEPLRPGHHVNICVRHTDYRPLPLQASASVGTTDSPPCSTAVSGASALTGVRFDQSPSIAAVSTPSNRRASLQWPGTSESNGSRWPIDRSTGPDLVPRDRDGGPKLRDMVLTQPNSGWLRISVSY